MSDAKHKDSQGAAESSLSEAERNARRALADPGLQSALAKLQASTPCGEAAFGFDLKTKDARDAAPEAKEIAVSGGAALVSNTEAAATYVVSLMPAMRLAPSLPTGPIQIAPGVAPEGRPAAPLLAGPLLAGPPSSSAPVSRGVLRGHNGRDGRYGEGLRDRRWIAVPIGAAMLAIVFVLVLRGSNEKGASASTSADATASASALASMHASPSEILSVSGAPRASTSATASLPIATSTATTSAASNATSAPVQSASGSTTAKPAPKGSEDPYGDASAPVVTSAVSARPAATAAASAAASTMPSTRAVEPPSMPVAPAVSPANPFGKQLD